MAPHCFLGPDRSGRSTVTQAQDERAESRGSMPAYVRPCVSHQVKGYKSKPCWRTTLKRRHKLCNAQHSSRH